MRGGERLRIRLSNVHGDRPLRIAAAHVALADTPGTGRIAPGGTALRFGGREAVFIPAGAEVYSDPVALATSPAADVAISIHLPEIAGPQTGHPGARATSFVAHGNHVAGRELPDPIRPTQWFFLADVETAGAAAMGGSIVAIGDSITDGYGVAPERNTRWPDFLAARLRANPATASIGVVNAGIGGNRVLRDGLGPNLLARFDRDAIARTDVRWVILLAGINDVGVLARDGGTEADHRAIVADVTGAYRQLVARAHAHGIRVIGATIMPFAGNDFYRPGPASEANRQRINAFIRSSGIFDHVVDFDALARDPARPDHLLPAYDLGDRLHPSEAGYRAMADAVPLEWFVGPAR
jgi:lysophospholipase L1-like esterase